MPVTINGSNTPTAGGVTYGDGTQYATTSAGTSGQALLSAGAGAPTWGTPASATTATNLAGGSAGTVPYQSASGTTAMLAAGTSGQVLTSSGAGAPSWTTISATPTIVRSARTSNTILGTADASTLIAITSGTFTQTFTAAATLGSGWFCYIQNSGTGDITLDPNGSETIDGLISYIMYPGEARLVQCDGTGFNTIVLNAFTKTYTTTTTFTRPPGYKVFSGLLWAGGGGGGASFARAGGGGGGACAPFDIAFSSMGSSQTITIGAGGSSVSPNNNGGVGGTSQIGTLAYAYGGGGGGTGGPGGNGGGGGGALSAGATGSNTDNAGGQPRSYVSGSYTSYSNAGFGGGTATDAAASGSSAYGGAAGGTANVTAGSSIYGGGGGSGSDNGGTFYGAGTSKYGGGGGSSDGVAGTAPSGGGAAGFGIASGAGARGQCTIWGIF